MFLYITPEIGENHRWNVTFVIIAHKNKTSNSIP